MKLLLTAIALVGSIGLSACDVDQTKEGELPDVDVSANGGQVPEFDVDGPDVKVGTENKTIEVPTVDVDPPKDDAKE